MFMGRDADKRSHTTNAYIKQENMIHYELPCPVGKISRAGMVGKNRDFVAI